MILSFARRAIFGRVCLSLSVSAPDVVAFLAQEMYVVQAELITSSIMWLDL